MSCSIWPAEPLKQFFSKAKLSRLSAWLVRKKKSRPQSIFLPLYCFYKTIHFHSSHYVYKNVHTLNMWYKTTQRYNQVKVMWSAAGRIFLLWRLQELIRIVNHLWLVPQVWRASWGWSKTWFQFIKSRENTARTQSWSTIEYIIIVWG